MTQITTKITRKFKSASLEDYYGPYTGGDVNVARHNAHTVLSNRAVGLNVIGYTVGIQVTGSNTIEEYWYQGGTAENNLVKKQAGYAPPAGGIPKSDLSSSVQTSLDNADTAYQKPVGGIPATDLESSVQETLDDAARLGEEYSSAIVPEIGADAVLLKAQQTLTLAEKEQVVSNIFDKTYGDAAYSGLGKVYLKRNIDNLGLPFTGSVNPVSVELTVLNETPAEIVWDSTRGKFLASNTFGPGVNKKYYDTWLHDDGYKNLTAGRRFYTYEGTHVVYYEYFSGTLNPVLNPIEANILTQDMLYKGDAGSRVPNTNTIFVIQDDFNLNNNVIEIPEGCVLEFDGGSLSNGKLILQDTELSGNPQFEGTIIDGSTKNSFIDTIWFNLGSDTENASINSTILTDYLLPSCENLGRELKVTQTLPINNQIVAKNFDLTCVESILWCGVANYDGAVVLLSDGELRHHTISVENNSAAGTYETRKDYGIIGVDCNNINNCYVCINLISDFTVGLRISATHRANANDRGNCYNTYDINKIVNSYKNLVLYRTQGTWVNENTINGGRLSTHSDSVFYGHNIGISFIKENITSPSGDHTFNNIIFNKPCCESANTCVYSNSKISDSSIIDIRNEAATTLVSEDDSIANTQDYYKCKIIPYRYINGLNRYIYKTFVINNKKLYGYSSYAFNLRALLYRYNNVDNKGIAFSDVLTFSNNVSTGVLSYNQYTVASEPVTPDCIKSDGRVGFLLKKCNGATFINGSLYLTGKEAEGVKQNSGVRIGFVLLDEDYKYLQKDDNNNINDFAGILPGYSFQLAALGTGSKYHYYITQTATNYLDFSFSNLPDKVKYIAVYISSNTEANLFKCFSGATLYVSDTFVQNIYPTGNFRVPGVVTGYFNMPLTAVYYFDNENRLCKVVPHDGHYTCSILDQGVGKVSDAQALITNSKVTSANEGYSFYTTDINRRLSIKNINGSAVVSETVAKNAAVYIENPFSLDKIYKKVAGAAAIKLYYSTTNADGGSTVEITSSVFEPFDSAVYPYLKINNTDQTYSRTMTVYEQVPVWLEDDGAAAGVARSGATSARPVGSSIYVGFMYMDTTLGLPIYASAINGDTVTWVKADGTDADA